MSRVAGVQRTIEERDKLLASALSAEGECDGGEAVDGVQSEQDIIVLHKGLC